MSHRPTLGLALLALASALAARPAAAAGNVELVLDDPDGVAGRTGVPLSFVHALPRGHRVVTLRDQATGHQTPGQFLPYPPAAGGEKPGKVAGEIWWLVPPGKPGKRTFALSLAQPNDTEPPLRVAVAEGERYVDVHDGDRRVLRFNFGAVPVPKGIPPRYARGGYIHPLCGPDGEPLTADYPRDHAHHRGVMWAWPVVRWKDQVRDPWAVSGMWTRPEKLNRTLAGPVLAYISATSVWKFDDKLPVAREDVAIYAFRQVARRRFVDIEVRLTALVDDLSLGGRPKAGYGGFGLRMAPRKAQQITLVTDSPTAKPRRSWIHYSDTFAGGTGRVGVAILDHITNPLYPSELHKYPHLNYVMPAFPGPREVPLPRGKPLTLRYRLWIHPGGADNDLLAAQWSAYASPPKTTLQPAK